jgi:tRNA A-37 threonylcarbamoyl transferase component Bud32
VVAAKLIDTGAEGRQHIDRYELVAEIAAGGMATVYLARLSGVGGFQRFVAIKRLHPHLANEREFVEMFLDEARLAAGIHHPNVVPIMEVGASERGYYIVMEYIEGDTLARLLARAASSAERLPPDISLRVVIDMLAGLHAAHELRDEMGQPTELVHRDVSPQNVLVGTDGIARITDFGVARASTRLSATRVGQLKGKIAYMAPEQAMGKSDVDRRADVFAAGIVLWEVLAGTRLFKAENEAGTLSRARDRSRRRGRVHEGARARSRQALRHLRPVRRRTRARRDHGQQGGLGARARRIRRERDRSRDHAAARSRARLAGAQRAEPDRAARPRFQRLCGGDGAAVGGSLGRHTLRGAERGGDGRAAAQIVRALAGRGLSRDRAGRGGRRAADALAERRRDGRAAPTFERAHTDAAAQRGGVGRAAARGDRRARRGRSARGE